MDSARGCPPGVSPLPPRYRRDGGKRRKERRDRKGGGRKGARKEEEEEKEESLQTGAFLVGPLLRFASSPSRGPETMGLYIVGGTCVRNRINLSLGNYKEPYIRQPATRRLGCSTLVQERNET